MKETVSDAMLVVVLKTGQTTGREVCQKTVLNLVLDTTCTM